MKISFHTNLDWYRQVQWPTSLPCVPHKGETVMVADKSLSFCEYNKIPNKLEVVHVEYSEDWIRIELWYRKIDVDRAALQRGGLEHLYKQ